MYSKTKDNTCKLVENQHLKIHKMIGKLGYKMYKINSTKTLEAISMLDLTTIS